MIHFKNLERDNSLADLTCTPCTTTTGIIYNIPSVCQQEKEKENTMSYAHAQAIYAAPAPQQTLEEKQRAYLVQRSREVCEEHLETLSKDFEVDPPKPKTVKEMREWLKTGHYTVDGKDDAEIDCLWDTFSWREKPFDQEGFDAAHESLLKAEQDAHDLMTIVFIEDALKALQRFQEWTYKN